eukprot:s2830_g11.t1
MLTALHIGPNEELVIDSEDFASAFNLFAVPDCWCPFFAYSKKVDGGAFGRPDLGQVRPALRVVAMGWRSSVTLIQAAVRRIVFDLAGVPRTTSVEKGAPLPAGKHFTVVYLDNFDEVRILKKFSDELQGEGSAPSDTHVKFNEVCDELGLPRNDAKQLVGALSGGIQGGEFDGVRGTIKIGKDKLRNFLAISLALLGQPLVTEFQMRHWIGKAAFIATFRRPLFSILQEVFELLEKCKGKAQPLPPAVVDEVVCFMVLATQAQSELKAKLSPVISCTDASPSGGGSAIATKFKTKSLVVPEEVPEKDVCGCCGTGFRGLDPERRLYVCPRKCGERFCSALCVADHSQGACTRQDFYAPTFGERFSGPRYPLTKACGLAGIAIQRPMDKLVPGDEWNILTESGKHRLAVAETDPALKAEHWAPECRTFSRARGRWIQLPDGGWIQGPRQVRSDDQPWGFNDLTKGDAVAVRQGNQFMKRAIKGLTKRHIAGGIASLEHPYNRYVWDTEEIAEMRRSGDWFETSYSHSCFGGTRVKWTLLFHNSPFLHQALHKPDCPGHADLENYRVTWTADGQLSFDTALEAEYPWGFCVTYANALGAHLRSITPEPVGTYPRTLESLIYTQVRGATRGLQDEQHVIRVVSAVCHVLSNMTEQEEPNHMQWLMRQVGLRGTDVRITVPNEQIQREVVHPYPAFRWLWRTVLSYKWTSEQHINVLEVTAVLTEFRRRLRDVDNINVRFLNIVDSMVTYYAVTKGRSGSKRMNRTLRRIMALNLASKSVMFSLWTLSKWNFADAASRRFERAYRKEIHKFFLFLSSEEEVLPNSYADLDAILAEYINVLFQNGDSLTQAGWLLSGFKRFVPRLRFQLPTAQQYYQNWLRDHVPLRAVPMPWLVAKALAAAAWQNRHYDVAILILVGFSFFLRSTEFLTLPFQNLVVDPARSTVVVTLDRAKTSKQFQQSLVLRNRTLALIVAQGLSRLSRDGPIWRFSARAFRESFGILLRHFQLEPFSFSLYSLRRGGATHVYAANRDIHFVAMQGRWRDVRTARIYLDDARATLEMAQFVHELEDIFRAIHAGVSEDYAVAISGLAYNLCASLGYEDEDELEEALGGPLVNFLEALPHFEVRWPEEGEQAEPRALMRPEPSEDLLDGKCLTFTVSERHDLFRVLLQGAHAEVEIPEIEFTIRPKAERRVDTIYNMMLG